MLTRSHRGALATFVKAEIKPVEPALINISEGIEIIIVSAIILYH